MDNRVIMTKEGSVQLRQELRHLKQEERPKIIQDVVVARAHGDLKENAEYHAAREKQSFLEKRITQIECQLSSAYIIDLASITVEDTVIFGCSVVLLNCETSSEINYRLVGEEEADASQGKIFYLAPLAQVILGKNTGDIVELNLQDRKVCYEIISVNK